VPSSALSTSSSSVTGSLTQTTNGGLTSTASSIDFTTASAQGQLAPATYTWSGYLYVPTTDTYTLDFQFSPTIAPPATDPVASENWSAGTATLTLPSGTPAPVGSQVTVTGACPPGYDGTFDVTASTATSVSYALPVNPGTCTESLSVTGATWSPGFSFGPFSSPPQATLNFASTSTPPSQGSTITVTGVSPSGYNGTFTVASSTATSVTYDLASNPGPYASGGTVAVSAAGAASIGGVQVNFNGSPVTLRPAAPVNSTGGASVEIAGSPTNAGYTQAGLTNMQYSAGTLSGGTFYPIKITFDNNTGAPASFRFGYNRANGDIVDAAAAAKGKSLAIVFLDDNGAPPEGNTPTALTMIKNPYYNPSEPVSDSNPPYIAGVESLPANQTQLVEAVAAANPNTVVVLNTTDPVLMPWVNNVKAVLEMWYSGEEGGTATARLLLGLADPSGHLPITFPANATDTIWAYNETVPLYPGDTLGPHFERLNGNGGCSAAGFGCPPDTTTVESEGIYTDYRFFDKEGITPLFPFGWGLSYTTFAFSHLHVSPASDGGLDVSFDVANTGAVAGTAVPQVYLGAPTSAPAGVQFAVRQLVQFTRVPLQPGQSELVNLHVGLRQLQYWSASSQQWLLATGERTIWVGDADSLSGPAGDPTAGSSLPLSQTVTIEPLGPSSEHDAATAAVGGSAGDVSCDDEQLSATTVRNLVVPKGQWCDVIDTTVTGNLTLDQGSLGARVAGSTVDGNFISVAAAKAQDPLSSGLDVLCNTTVKGNVLILSSGSQVPWDIGLCGGNTIGRNLVFNANRAAGNAITGNTVGGNLVCNANGGVAVSANTTKGRTLGDCGGQAH